MPKKWIFCRRCVHFPAANVASSPWYVDGCESCACTRRDPLPLTELFNTWPPFMNEVAHGWDDRSVLEFMVPDTTFNVAGKGSFFAGSSARS